MRILLFFMACIASTFASASDPGVIVVIGSITKITNRAQTPCEMSPYQYLVTGDYRFRGVIKNFSACFDSIAIPLIGSQDHGGSPTGNMMTDANITLEKLAGKPVRMTFTVYHPETLQDGLQTLLAIEPN